VASSPRHLLLYRSTYMVCTQARAPAMARKEKAAVIQGPDQSTRCIVSRATQQHTGSM
jgi:hypothetical protein